MSNARALIRKCMPALQTIFTMIWLSNLASTEAYFSVYVLIAFLSFYLSVKGKGTGGKHSVLCGVLSALFSVLVLIANYEIFTQLRDPARVGASTNLMLNLVNSCLSLIGGYCAANPILRFVFETYPIGVRRETVQDQKKLLPFLVFGSILCIDLVHLFLVEYPGNVTEDSFTQISEMAAGEYSNFNTFWHTMLFRAVLSAGYALFSDVNAAIALCCVLQTAVMAFAFTHCLMTMGQLGVPRYFLIGAYLIYALVPYNMALCITLWKDVLFAGGCLLMISAWLRIMKGSGSVWNYLVFILGSLLFILSRTNGWIIYLASFAVYAVFVRKNKKFLAVMGALAVCGLALLNPVLSMLNISGSDLAESLSIPIQQVARVIADGEELTEEEAQLLSRVVDLEEVPQLYTDWISDPMKVEVRSKDYGYFQEHLDEYAKLWVRLGLRYPGSYLKAWVDQTKGYWNGGYGYAMYSETVTDNPYGVEKTGGGNPIASLFRLYFGLSRHVIFFEPLHSIGLHVWIVILCFLLNIVKKREVWVLSVPVLVLVVGLWFGTPVYSCFRYVYPLFVSFPLLLSTAIYQPKETE